ncbi:fimbria/pilus outer membrane usher protein [Salmonella enterica]|uniref:fimbria/pilus outer membrane usher protein n=1 Tax=Salmonella enterica TaxID=28901 RepID=UPI003D2FD42C
MPQQGRPLTATASTAPPGLNLGPWRLRSDYQYSRLDSGHGASQSDFYLPQTYLFRALPALRSKLTLGQTYLSSAIFDSFRFAGLTLASDERMLPPLCRGMPRKSAVLRTVMRRSPSARTAAFCTRPGVAGAFELPDLSQNISGNLDVTVRESDGSVRTGRSTRPASLYGTPGTGSL